MAEAAPAVVRSAVPMRTFAIIALVVLILLMVIPLGIGVAVMGACPDCHAPAALCGLSLCLAFLGTLMIVSLGFAERARPAPAITRILLLARSLERPPRPL